MKLALRHSSLQAPLTQPQQPRWQGRRLRSNTANCTPRNRSSPGGKDHGCRPPRLTARPAATTQHNTDGTMITVANQQRHRHQPIAAPRMAQGPKLPNPQQGKVVRHRQAAKKQPPTTSDNHHTHCSAQQQVLAGPSHHTPLTRMPPVDPSADRYQHDALNQLRISACAHPACTFATAWCLLE